ncbi:hypothetical protein MKX01_015034 [Papaver californicum]|nr:hypothetical protein MKX01_015034 [Papaver californicum]
MFIRALHYYVRSAPSLRSFSSDGLVEATKHGELGIVSGISQEHLHKRGLSSPSAGNMCTIASISTSSKKGLSTSAFEAFFEDNEEGDAPCIIQEKDYLRKSHNSKEGVYVLDLIDQGSIVPDHTLYNKLLKKCTYLGKLREGRMVHEHFLKSKFKSDLFILNTIVNMYTKCGSLNDAKKMFDEMPCKDMVTWTALISGYSQNDRPEEALALFPQMIDLGLKPNQFTFGSLLKASGSAATDTPGRQVHAFVVNCGYSSDVYVASSLVDMYARFDRIKEAQVVFDGMKLALNITLQHSQLDQQLQHSEVKVVRSETGEERPASSKGIVFNRQERREKKKMFPIENSKDMVLVKLANSRSCDLMTTKVQDGSVVVCCIGEIGKLCDYISYAFQR